MQPRINVGKVSAHDVPLGQGQGQGKGEGEGVDNDAGAVEQYEGGSSDEEWE